MTLSLETVSVGSTKMDNATRAVTMLLLHTRLLVQLQDGVQQHIQGLTEPGMFTLLRMTKLFQDALMRRKQVGQSGMDSIPMDSNGGYPPGDVPPPLPPENPPPESPRD